MNNRRANRYHSVVKYFKKTDIKKIIILLVVLFNLSCTKSETNDASSNCIFEGDIVLKSQEEVDEFIKHNYCTIKGSLIIGNEDLTTKSNIYNISGLLSLNHIKNNLIISQNPNLISLQGLENLKEIGGSLTLAQNGSLQSLNKLISLNKIGYSLYVYSNNSLVNLKGLEKITLLKSFGIEANQNLINLEGFENLENSNSLYISGNQSLTSLKGLNNLKYTSYLNINSNKSLTNLEDLSNLNSNKGDVGIDIYKNPSLISLTGFEGLTKINGIDLRENLSLNSLDGLENITSINTLRITYNPELTILSELKNVLSIGNSENSQLDIHHNSNLISLKGLENVISFKGNIWIMDNIKLRNLCPLQQILSNGTYKSVNILYNFYNPTAAQIISGNNCSI